MTGNTNRDFRAFLSALDQYMETKFSTLVKRFNSLEAKRFNSLEAMLVRMEAQLQRIENMQLGDQR